MRGRRYAPEAAASPISRHSSALGTADAAAMSTFATLNSVDSDWIGPPSPGASWGTPAIAHTSASPEASTKADASTQRSPPLFHSRTAARRPSSTRTPVAQVWSSRSTPASSARRSQRTLRASAS